MIGNSPPGVAIGGRDRPWVWQWGATRLEKTCGAAYRRRSLFRLLRIKFVLPAPASIARKVAFPGT
jgi:hypothetical protein